MNKVGLWFLRLLGFKRPQPRTRLGKFARNSERTLTAVALVYLALLFFPQVLFAYNVSAQGVTIYSRTPLPAETASRINEAMALVRSSELSISGRTERIFICGNPWLFRLFAPLSPKSFATSWPVTDNIFIAEADPANNVARSAAPEHNRRSFSGVAAHEITHGLIRQRLGLLRGSRLSAWVAEGYCDYVAREGSFPEEEGLQALRESREERSPSFQYFVSRQMVRYLAEDRHLSFEEIVGQSGGESAVRADMIRALKGPQE